MMEARMANSCLARRLPRLKRMKSTTRRAKIQGKVLRTLHLIECLVNPAQDERASAGHLYGAASVLFFLKRRSEWVLSASKVAGKRSLLPFTCHERDGLICFKSCPLRQALVC
eukprot:scaffold232511_cov19-Tisochrysis_lutea.AAC.1